MRGRVRGLVQGDDVDRHARRGDVPGGVVHRVDQGAGAGSVAGAHAHDVVGDEGRGGGRVHLVLEAVVHRHAQPGRGAVVAQDAHAADVAGAHDERVVGEHRRVGGGGGGRRDDGDAPLGGAGRIGHRVGDLLRRRQAAGRGDAQDVVLEQGDDERRPLARAHRLDHQDPAAGVVVVVQDVDEGLPAGRQGGDVVLGDRRARGVRGDDVDPDDAGDRGGSVGERVLQVGGAGGPAGHGDHRRARVELGADAGGDLADGGHAQRVPVGVGVVDARVDLDGLPLRDDDVVAARHRRDVLRPAHVHQCGQVRLRPGGRYGFSGDRLKLMDTKVG